MKVAFIEVSLASGNLSARSAGSDLLKAAAGLSLETIVVTRNPSFYSSLAEALVSRWIVADTTDPQAIAAALRPVDPDAVLSSSDLFIDVADKVSEMLGLPYNGTAAVSRDKSAVRAALDDRGIRSARWSEVTCHGEAPAGMHFPVVVKPVDGAGKTGVRIVGSWPEVVDAAAGLSAGADYGRGVRAKGRALVEEFISGPLFSVEGMIWGADTFFWGTTSRLIVDDTFVVARGGVFLSMALEEDVDAYVRAVVAAVGLRFGVFHMELIRGVEGLVLVEINTRLMGSGWHALIDYATGASVCAAILSGWLGRGGSLPLSGQSAAVVRHLAPFSGQLTLSSDGAAAMAVDGVRDVVFLKHPGDHVQAWTQGADILSQVYAVGGRAGSALENAELGSSMLHFHVE